jgi:HEAT repeat protein
VSAGDFERLVAVAFWTSIVLLACAACLMAYTLVLHRRNVTLREHRDDVVDTWRAIFVGSLKGEVRVPPRLSDADGFIVLATWNAVNESPGDAVMPGGLRLLDAAARGAGLDVLALGYVEHGDVAERIVGATALGYLRDARATDRLRTLADDQDGDVSFAAAASLLKIDPSSAKAFVARLSRRPDWVPTRVERAATEAAAIVGAALPDAIAQADGEERIQLLRYAGMLGVGIARAAVAAPLHGEADAETIAAALRTLRGIVEVSDVPLLRRYAEHPFSAVRVQAVNALGRLRGPEVKELLLTRLHDSNAWVRQRAAEALAATVEDQRSLLDRVGSDKFAYQSLRHALEDAARREL